MKSKQQETGPHVMSTKKPAKAIISKAEFRRRLKNIVEWRKKRLAELPHIKDSR
jgi:hypothetical protein